MFGFATRSALVALEARVAQLEANDPARAAALLSASKQLQRHLERLRWADRKRSGSDEDEDDTSMAELLRHRGVAVPNGGEDE